MGCPTGERQLFGFRLLARGVGRKVWRRRSVFGRMPSPPCARLPGTTSLASPCHRISGITLIGFALTPFCFFESPIIIQNDDDDEKVKNAPPPPQRRRDLLDDWVAEVAERAPAHLEDLVRKWAQASAASPGPYAQVHARTHVYAHVHARTFMCTFTHTFTHARLCARSRARSRTHTFTHARKCSRSLAEARSARPLPTDHRRHR